MPNLTHTAARTWTPTPGKASWQPIRQAHHLKQIYFGQLMVPALQALWPEARECGQASSSTSTRLVLPKVFSFRQDGLLARNENCRVAQSAAGTEQQQQQKLEANMQHATFLIKSFAVCCPSQQASLSADKSHLDNRPSAGWQGM